MRFPIHRVRLTPSLTAKAKSAIESLNSEGAWLKQGDLKASGKENLRTIDTRVFIRNLNTLADFVAAKQKD
ncbi:MAG TPA: hypothetical protein DCY03_06030 [Planctomycetaceae bacterium]|nr:hypothetical protein [Planctomycetaceae bacterium]